jgi:hypothetical protein
MFVTTNADLNSSYLLQYLSLRQQQQLDIITVELLDQRLLTDHSVFNRILGQHKFANEFLVFYIFA